MAKDQKKAGSESGNYRGFTIRLAITIIIGFLIVDAYFIYTSYTDYLHKSEQQVMERLAAITSTAALGIDGNEHLKLQNKFLEKDAVSENRQDSTYSKLQQNLNAVQNSNNLNTSIYTLFWKDDAQTEEDGWNFYYGVTSQNPCFRHSYDSAPDVFRKNFNEGSTIPVYTTESGEVKLKANLINLQNRTLQLQFEVSDSGIGIPEHKLDKVWDSFSQASSDTTRKFGGTGLGLTIVKRLVGLHHGGKISLKSTLGEGTTFTVDLNLQTSAKSAKEIEKSKVLENDGTLEGIKILLAEDNRLNQVVATKVLAKMGIEAEIANNGIEALEMAQSGNYAMVLMDIQMPDMDGYEATRRIRKLDGEKGLIPIVALTADVAPSVTKRCMEVGMNDYLPKPFQEKELFQKMKRWANIDTTTETEVVDPIVAANTSKLINMATLEDMADGNTEFIDEMINMFLEDTPDCLTKIEAALHEEDFETIQRISHKMKPSMGFMGMPNLEATIAEMEKKAAAKGDISGIQEMYVLVKAQCDQAFIELKQELKRA